MAVNFCVDVFEEFLDVWIIETFHGNWKL